MFEMIAVLLLPPSESCGARVPSAFVLGTSRASKLRHFCTSKASKLKNTHTHVYLEEEGELAVAVVHVPRFAVRHVSERHYNVAQR